MFKCYYSDCSNIYKTRFNLRRHINSSHLKIKRFICEECEKHFVSKQNLKEHYYIHTGEKPFLCNEPACYKRFRQVSQLTIHKRIHYRKRPGSFVSEIENLQLSTLILGLAQEKLEGQRVSLQLRLPEFRSVNLQTKLPVLPSLLEL